MTSALSPIELVLSAAAANSTDELAQVRLEAIRSRRLMDKIPASPAADQPPAGVSLLGGLPHRPTLPLHLSARIGLIGRRRGRGEGPGEDD